MAALDHEDYSSVFRIFVTCRDADGPSFLTTTKRKKVRGRRGGGCRRAEGCREEGRKARMKERAESEEEERGAEFLDPSECESRDRLETTFGARAIVPGWPRKHL